MFVGGSTSQVNVPAGSHVGDILVWDGSAWISSYSLPALTDATAPIFVNATTGDDTATGLTSMTALKSLNELAKRYQGRIVSGNKTITLTGVFTEPLILECAGEPGTQITVNGATPTVVSTGSITGAYQAYAAAANTDARIIDAARTWTTNVGQRIRMTSGAANTGIAWILKDLGANTARISQLVDPATGNKSANPGAADTYTIETLPTQVAGFHCRIGGGMKLVINNIDDVISSDANTAQYLVASGQVALTTDQSPMCRVVGCKFSGTINHNFNQSHFGMYGTYSTVAISFTFSRVLLNSHAYTATFTASSASKIDVQVHLVGQGAGLRTFAFSNIQLAVDGNSVAAGCPVYDAAGSACLDIEGGSAVEGVTAGNTIWGTGNTSTQTVRVRSNGAFCFLTSPPAGIGPATDALVGGTAFTWAAIAGAAQSSVQNANNGAVCGSRL